MEVKTIERMVRSIEAYGIRGVDFLQIAVEDYRPGCGRITIVADTDAWSHYWGAMETHSMEDFFLSASTPYLVKKLKYGIRRYRYATSEDVVHKYLRKEILKLRRQNDLSRDKARELWDDIETIEACDNVAIRDILSDMGLDGSCWPKEPNPEYEHICFVVDAVKEVLWKNSQRRPSNTRVQNA